jgi:hypothetical protein
MDDTECCVKVPPSYGLNDEGDVPDCDCAVCQSPRVAPPDAWNLVARELDATADDGEDAAAVAITDRLRVPGGWLYRVTKFNESGTPSFCMPATVALAFVPEAS